MYYGYTSQRRGKRRNECEEWTEGQWRERKRERLERRGREWILAIRGGKEGKKDEEVWLHAV